MHDPAPGGSWRSGQHTARADKPCDLDPTAPPAPRAARRQHDHRAGAKPGKWGVGWLVPLGFGRVAPAFLSRCAGFGHSLATCGKGGREARRPRMGPDASPEWASPRRGDIYFSSIRRVGRRGQTCRHVGHAVNGTALSPSPDCAPRHGRFCGLRQGCGWAGAISAMMAA